MKKIKRKDCVFHNWVQVGYNDETECYDPIYKCKNCGTEEIRHNEGIIKR